MITIFNRKELIITFSMEHQAKIRDILAVNSIDYSLKMINRNSPSVFSDTRARTGTLGQNMQTAYEYVFYVHKSDYDRAFALLNGNYAK